MRDSKISPATITFGDDSVVVRRQGKSQVIVANILGAQTEPHSKSVWLDRLVHQPKESLFMEGDKVWTVTGAISTVLTCSNS